MIIKEFEEQVTKFAEKHAVITEKKQLTYSQLNSYANGAALTIRSHNTNSSEKETQHVVGLLFEHSADMIIGVLGTLKADKIYLPLDINYPENRLVYMLEDSGTHLLLTNNSNLPLAERLVEKVNHDLTIINLDTIDNTITYPNIERAPKGDKLAYILYTSGSTGKPKGVLQDHKNVCYYIRNWTERFSITPADRMTLFSAFSHDGAGQDMFGALHNGATLYPYNILKRTNIAELSQWLIDEKITIWHSVPTLYRYFADTLKDRPGGTQHFPHLRLILLGGEQIREHDIEIFKRFFPNAKFANVYGQTESSVNSIWIINPEDTINKMLIGEPLDETELLIVDDEGTIVEDLGLGEIIVACQHLALGYWNDKQNTQRVFLHDPEMGPLYRTGDLGRLLPDGNIEMMGRKDSQVKIRGFRIEVGEIETLLLNHKAIKEAVVVARTDNQNNTHLYGYYVPEPSAAEPGKETDLTVSELRKYLAGEVPEYMIPSFFVKLEQMPLTPNGKVDRKRLPEPEHTRPQLAVNYVAPETNLEKQLSDIWLEVLQLDKVGLDDNFFDLGGTSFDILKIISKLYDVFKKDIPVVSLFRYPTLRSFVEYLRQEESSKSFSPRRKSPVSPASTQIAVIGMAGRFPGAKNINEFWENLKNGVESISFFSRKELEQRDVDSRLLQDPNYVNAFGTLPDIEYFDAAFFNYSPAEARMMDPQLRLLHECSWQALENAGYHPDNYDGLIGLYAGNAPNQYWTALTYMHQKSSLDTAFLNSNYSTKVSYKLNLKGPSVIVQTACSTSLVAIHFACQGLINGECDMALAGGVSISLPDKRGYLYREGMILSPNGHCRAFDAGAGGTIFGNGVGIVVLKRLQDAIDDGDTIDAVIKGSAINNDGNRKVGLTAPSVEGQAEVIAAAREIAGVPPESITYIETHGTGTILGDPVEIEALQLAFATAKKRYCAIGSVKPNVGHLNTAAGAAGFIKAVLALKHKILPPSVNFKTPNPKIDFENSPFYVNTYLTQWKDNGYPLRAGVSSFGIGGTNAHVILEESPIQSSSLVHSIPGGAQEYQLILLSAKTPSALEKITQNLISHLKENPDIHLGDVAYTLQMGRKAFQHRRMTVCTTPDEVVEILSAAHSGNGVKTFATDTGTPRPIFMFSGQGAQYVNMGRDLYENQPLFRQEMNRCFEILNGLLDYDLKEILYPGNAPQSTQSTQSEKFYNKTSATSATSGTSAVDINQTAITQPVLFIFEYALARLLMEWGIKPYAMIGHSIGEYVAACLSGVFSLEDALKLVVLRGKLMQQMPGGAMLGVPLAEEELTPLLKGQLSLAAVNSTSHCVVSGPTEAIAAFARQLEEKGHTTRTLHTSHAFHSRMMEPILQEFTESVGKVNLNQPRIPYISNVSGKWITVGEAADHGYWARHLRSTVRFADGLTELLKEQNAFFIEVGPGKSLSTFARQHHHKNPPHQVIDLIRHPNEKVSDNRFLLNQIGHLWLYGIPFDWTGFHGDKKRCRIPLPAYPFEGQPFWLEGDPFKLGSQQLPAAPAPGKKTNMEEWFYQPLWKLSPLPDRQPFAELTRSKSNWLVLMNETTTALQLAQLLQKIHRQEGVILVKSGSEFTPLADDEAQYAINPHRENDYRTLFEKLHSSGQFPQKILHLWTISEQEGKNHGANIGEITESVEKTLDLGFYSLLHLAQTIGEYHLNENRDSVETEIIVVTDRMQVVTGGEILEPHKATLCGAVQVISREYPAINCRTIDIDTTGTTSSHEDPFTGILLTEIEMGTRIHQMDMHVAYRNNQRWAKTFQQTHLEVLEQQVPMIKEKGVYLVTGGLGGIGLVLAEYLAKTFKARLILTGRSAFPEPGQWENWLNSHGETDSISLKIRKIREMEASGAEVLVQAADAANLQQMQEAVSRAEKQFGKINGIIHSAGVPDGALVQRRTREISETVFTPKIKGTLVLDAIFNRKELDFIVLCSSISSVLAPVGQVAYCAANAFLDAYAQQRIRDNTLTVSINWDNWQQVGMAAKAVAQHLKIYHPLFQNHEIYDSHRERLISHLNINDHWVLAEHRIMGNAALPGTAYLEMVRTALQFQSGNRMIELQEVYFLNPLLVKENETKEIHTLLKKENSDYTFSIISRLTPGEDRWMEHARGKAVVMETGKSTQYALAEIEKKCSQEEMVYDPGTYTGQRGAMTFGPRWNNLKWVKFGKNQGLALLELPETFAHDIGSYKFHPALVDIATTFLHSARENHRRSGAYLPFYYKSIKLKGPLPGKVYCYARAVNSDDNKSPRETRKFDITIMNEQGTALVEIEEFTLKRVDMVPPVSKAAEESDRWNFSLVLPSKGTFDDFVFQPVPRKEPGPGQVEIAVYATGLNFKEVLLALGALEPIKPDFAFGLECAGKITAVGENVEGFAVGDDVIAFATSCFSPYIVTPTALVAHKPLHLGMEEAATIPLAFMTSYYALIKLAQLKRGERILIHSAAGGVGLAAVKIAQWKEAEIFATAGTEQKRAYLQSIGIQHIMDSRNLDFVEEVMKKTNNKGVHVVLNSLAGGYISKSISLLAPYGRFIEIGMRDMLKNTSLELRPFLKGLSYYSLFLSADLPDIGSIWSEIVQHFEKETFTPLPLQTFPIDRVGQAFDYMTKGKHIGKIVVTRDHQEESPARKQNQYKESHSYQFFFQETSGQKPAAEKLKNGILPLEGVDIFKRILGKKTLAQVIVSTTDLFHRIQKTRISTIPQLSKELSTEISAQPKHHRPELSTPYTAPQTQIEKQLVLLWENLLGIQQIGIYDDFFELGGDSLKAVNFSARIKKELNTEVPISELFNCPNIKMLAQYIAENSETAVLTDISPVEAKEYYPLSAAQQRLYILNRLEQGSLAYNLVNVNLLKADVGLEKLQQAFEKTIRRHESLRTSFAMIDGKPIQKIHDWKDINFTVEYHDIEGREAKEQDIIQDFVKPFDLSKSPLLRAGLLKITGEKYLLITDMHHIISDATSYQVFLSEVAAFYENQEPPPLTLQYKDYAEWQRNQAEMTSSKKQEEYWLSTFSAEIPVINLPTDYPRPALQSFAGSLMNFVIDKKETLALKNLAKEEDATLFMTLLALTNILLMKLSGQEDIIVGTPVAGRTHPDIQSTIGIFANTLALRNLLPPNLGFKALLKDLKKQTLKAFENQDYPFEKLVEQVAVSRDLSRNPLFDVMFLLRNETTTNWKTKKQPEKEGDQLALKPFRYKKVASQFDLSFICFEKDQRLFIDVEYCSKLFKEETIERFIGYFQAIVASVLENQEEELAQIDILSTQERNRLLKEFNDTQTPYSDKTLYELIEEQVNKIPHHTALVAQGVEPKAHNRENHHKPCTMRFAITYQKLNEKSNQLAYYLRSKGVAPGTIVGILVKRTNEMIIALVGILKAGAAYLPLDPDYPRERINHILKNSGTKVLLASPETQTKVKAEAEEGSGHPQGLPLEIINIEKDIFNFSKIASSTSTLTSTCEVGPANLAYVIYTSGSTGNPKGVVIRHRNVVNFITGMNAKIDFAAVKRLLALTTISFDIFVLETWLPLSRGMQVVIATGEQQIDSQLLAETIIRQGIDILQLTPSRLKLLFNSDNRLTCLKRVRELIVGGEAFPAHLLNHLQKVYPGRLYNVYGPTETTVWSTCKELTAAKDVTIGTPIANTQIYIESKYNRLQPPGIAGELLIGGDGLAAGYLNNIELTAEKFISRKKTQKDTKKFSPPSPIYRTGDLARWLSSGEIEFLGRIDYQVKVRGFRVETEEIEDYLLADDRIKEAVVLDQTDNTGETYLVAYIVTKNAEPLDHNQLRENLSHTLPEYMIPAFFNQLEKIPLTPNGKIDRKALPEPKIAAGKEVTAPTNPTEETLTTIWSEVLALNKKDISIYASFFQLGGHSLKATILLSRIHKEFDVKIPLGEIFKTPNIKGLAKYINQTAQEKYQLIRPVEKRDRYVLSTAQKRLYILQQLDTNSIGYNISFALQLEGEIDRKKLEDVFKTMISHHEILRTSFEMVHGKPVQRIHDQVEFEMEYYDSGKQGNREVGSESSQKFPVSLSPSLPESIKNFLRPFDLSRAPLLRVGLINTKENHYILIVDMHHIVTDGSSWQVWTREFTALYAGQKLPPLPLQYKDYAQWQNTREQQNLLKQQETYWLNLFSHEVPILNLPTDYPRPAIQSFAGASWEFTLDAEETKNLREIAHTTEATLYMVILAAFNILLARLSGQEDIIVGTPVAARRHVDLEQIIGVFINTLAMRNYPTGNKTFIEFLKEVKNHALAAYDNQEYPFEELVNNAPVKRDLTRNPLFDVMLILHNELNLTSISQQTNTPLTVKPYKFEKRSSQFDLTLAGWESEHHLRFTVEYCTRLFKKETLQRYMSYFKKIIGAVTAHPNITLAEIDIFSAEEKYRLLQLFNDTKTTYPDRTLHELFEEQVHRTPDHTALVAQGAERNAHSQEDRHAPCTMRYAITYQELNNKSHQLAQYLRSKGVTPCAIVGILAERSNEMIIGLLAILKAGAAYLPLDPEYPPERINYILKNSGTEILLKSNTLEPNKSGITVLDFEHLDFEYVPNFEFRASNLNPSNLAYIIYTSGSTGNPKGVMVRHKNAVNFIKGMTSIIDFSAGKSILALTTISFDIFFLETLLPLTCGMQVVIASEAQQKDPQLLAAAIMKTQVNILQTTPSRLQLLLNFLNHLQFIAGVETLLVGGEAFPAHLFENLAEKFPGKIYNVYGPTETTIWSTVKDLTGCKPAGLTIGSPIANTQIYIVNKNMELQPLGVPGELLIGGDGVATGYLNNIELTAEKFINSHRSHRPYLSHLFKNRLYRTGDLARWLPNGEIECLGREDHQVKIRGFRIELEEIEEQLVKHPDIKEAVVTAKTNKNGDKYLAAYIVPELAHNEKQKELSVEEMTGYLSQKLPHYMIPSGYTSLEKIPLTPNGKVNRLALPEPGESRFKTALTHMEPATEKEKDIATLWEEILEVDKVGIYDDFFGLGGNSFHVIQLNNRLREALGINIPVALMFKYTTISSQAQYLNRQKTDSDLDNKREEQKQAFKQAGNLYKNTINRYRSRGAKNA